MGRGERQLGASIETALADESGGPVGNLIPLPVDGGDGGDDDPLRELKADIRKMRGNTLLVETASAGFGDGRAAAPQRDWMARRLGANPPAALVELRTAIETTIAAACGIPPALVSAGADGTAQRESYRRWLHGSVRPLAALVEAELSAKLEQPVRLSFDSLHAADVQGRARAWRSLVGRDATMPDADARRLCGLD